MAVATSERGAYYDSPPQQDGRKPLWHEALVGLEIGVLITSSIYRKGEGVPRGDGSSVIVVPGYGSNDSHTKLLRDWLKKIGYNAMSSRIPISNFNPEFYEEEIITEVDEAFRGSGKKVHLVGHSIGGVLARLIAARRADKVKSVTTLGSPLFGEPEDVVDPFVLTPARISIPLLRNRERLDQRKREISQSLSHKGVRRVSIYSKRDGVVAWPYCVDPDPDTENYEVDGSHMGLIFNPDAYGYLGQTLAKPRLADITDFPLSSRSAA